MKTHDTSVPGDVNGFIGSRNSYLCSLNEVNA